MNILYIGSSDHYSTAWHRASALTRIGHQVEIIDPENLFPNAFNHRLWSKVNYHSGYIFIAPLIARALKAEVNLRQERGKIDLVWVDSGELIHHTFSKWLRSAGVISVLFNVDDPTGTRDGNRFRVLKKALLHYDLVVGVRKETVEEFKNMGCRKSLLVTRSYDEVAHRPFDNKADIPVQFKSEVCFIGTWMRHENRDRFLLDLIEAGIPLSIWGNRWKKSKYWPQLSAHYRGPALGGADYVSAIQRSDVCIGLLSKGNRDQVTTRSFEIPFAGGLLCAERTNEHTNLYRDNFEAVFWEGSAECIRKIRWLLTDDSKRESIRLAGMQRVRENVCGNEDVCREVIDELK